MKMSEIDVKTGRWQRMCEMTGSIPTKRLIYCFDWSGEGAPSAFSNTRKNGSVSEEENEVV